MRIRFENIRCIFCSYCCVAPRQNLPFYRVLTNSTGCLLSRQQPWFVTVNLRYFPASLCRPQIQSITPVMSLSRARLAGSGQRTGSASAGIWDFAFPPQWDLPYFTEESRISDLQLLSRLCAFWKYFSAHDGAAVLKIWQAIFDF